MQSGFKVLKYHCQVLINEMTRYQVPKEETSINLTNTSCGRQKGPSMMTRYARSYSLQKGPSLEDIVE